MSALNKLYREYKGRAEFFLVYIREAHPTGSQRPDRQIHVDDPDTLEERAEVAGSCQTELGLEMPILIDNMDNAAQEAYCAWPDRLFLIDARAKIAYRGGLGPQGFKPAELQSALEAMFGKP